MVRFRLLALAMLGWLLAGRAEGVIVWSDLGEVTVRENGTGADITGAALKRDDTARDVLYFKFRVDPLSDVGTELYCAAFQLFEGERERLAIGNSLKAWAYSAFNTAEKGQRNEVEGDMDLRSSRPETTEKLGVFYSYEFPRRGAERTIVFRVQYVPGANDLVTVWLDPDLSAGATETTQSTNLITRFTANASFDQIHLRHNGGGEGWTFSEMAIATAFTDFVKNGGPVLQGSRPVATSLSVRSWQHEQGLPYDGARSLAQTPDGYLWIGSDEGIARFDGARFVTFGEREGVPGGRVQVLFADSSGALWIGSSTKGLGGRKGGSSVILTTTNGLPSDSITALAEDSQKRLWVGTDSGLVLVADGHVAELAGADELKGKPVASLLRGRHGDMWVAVTGAGVFRWSERGFVALHDPGVDALLLDPHCILEDQDGRIWIGAGDDLVLCREGSQWHRYRVPRRASRPYVRSLAEGPDGSVWAGSVSEGVFHFQDGRLEPLNANGVLSDNLVQALLVDREGSIWAGTESGLNRIRRNNLLVLSQTEGLGYAPAKAMAEVGLGKIWVAQPRQGIFSFEGRRFSRVGDADFSTKFSDVNSLLPDGQNGCWVASESGVAHLRGVDGESPREEEQDGLDGKNALCMARDFRNTLWAGTAEGELWRFENHRWLEQTKLLTAGSIQSLAADRAGNIWFGTPSAGLWQYRTTRNSTAKVKGIAERIRTLAVDGEDVLWIGTGGGGLIRCHGENVATLTTKQGLPDDTILEILFDQQGNAWIGTERGIACIAKKDLDPAVFGKAPVIYPTAYGRAEGMLAEECAPGFSSAGLVTHSGLLWFPTIKGIAVIDPFQQKSLSPPNVLIEDVLVDGQSMRPGTINQPLRIGPGKHAIEFDYTCPSFRAPERVRFRYQLEAIDGGLVDAKARRLASYPYLPAGEYRFHVAACNGEGQWSESAAVSLVVTKYFWQSAWFLAGGPVVLVGLVAGAVRLAERRKHRQRLRQFEQERALERERARIAQDLHDDLGSSLTRVSLLGDLLRADKDSPAQVESHAGKISQTARQTVRSLEEIVWALRPGSDSLPSLVDYLAHVANEMFEGDSVKCRMDLPHDLPARTLQPELRHNIYLIVKEALTNSLKHARAREVRLEVKVTEERLQVIIADDGAGFDPAISRNGNGPHHNGLGNMRRRAEAIGGDLEVRSATGTGTTILLTVNLPVTNGKVGNHLKKEPI